MEKKFWTAKELMELENPIIGIDSPNDVASYLNAKVMIDVMTTVGLKLSKKEIIEIEHKVNTRLLTEMISFLENIGNTYNVSMDEPIKHLSDIIKEIPNTK